MQFHPNARTTPRLRLQLVTRVIEGGPVAEFARGWSHGPGPGGRQVQVGRGGGCYQSTPRIMQLSPLPIPKSPTRSPDFRKPRSSASAAVSGSETVPMLPR